MALFNRDRILTLDIGASKLVLAEFTANRQGATQLVNYGIEPLGIEPEGESDPSAYIVSTVRELMREWNIRPAPVLMTISGQAVFPRYVKLPPVTRDKVMQIIRYEAEQNVPFPIEEVVWDYQLIESGEGDGDLNVMLVAVKTDRVTSLTDCVLAAGLEPEIVDVAPMALYNAVRYNYPSLEGCTMVLDIGARSSNVIFVEEKRIFSRSIPVAGNAITQEIMKAFDLPFREAEELKREHAFVAFGGVYAGADNDTADRVSKIVRTVVTRLHAEVNRSVNFYRSQQGGSPPSLVLLTGGSSTLPHMDTFFREKLRVQVDYLNPFTNVSVSSQIDEERIGRDAFLMGEVTGLALRNALVCPVEINLMPSHIVARKVFRKRQPFFVVAAICIILTMLCWWAYFQRMSGSLADQVRQTEERIADLQEMSRRMKAARETRAVAEARFQRLSGVVGERTRWLHVLDALHRNVLDGMWLTALEPLEQGGDVREIRIQGQGFIDKIESGTEVETFRDRLIASPEFGEGTRIERLRDAMSGDYAVEFTIVCVLEEPIAL